jgi:hypothetical protein
VHVLSASAAVRNNVSRSKTTTRTVIANLVFSNGMRHRPAKSAEVLHMNANPVVVVAPREELAKLKFKPSQ